jgi:hypothetical protein
MRRVHPQRRPRLAGLHRHAIIAPLAEPVHIRARLAFALRAPVQVISARDNRRVRDMRQAPCRIDLIEHPELVASPQFTRESQSGRDALKANGFNLRFLQKTIGRRSGKGTDEALS